LNSDGEGKKEGFFFEKKNQKTFACYRVNRHRRHGTAYTRARLSELGLRDRVLQSRTTQPGSPCIAAMT
jgi:hypothetical protein